MPKTVKNKLIAKPDWMLEDKDVLDDERQLYVALAMEQKFNKVIEAGSLSNLYEIFFHFLNINALFSDHKLYDEHFGEIQNNDKLRSFVRDMRYEDGESSVIISQTNEVYTRILLEYITLALKMLDTIDVRYFDNRNIHFDNIDAYIICQTKKEDSYELWKAEFGTQNKLGSKLEMLDTMTVAPGNTEELRKYVKEYNKENPLQRIRAGNFIGIASRNNKIINTKNAILLVRDIILLNKIFYNENAFNPNILNDINRVVKERNTFPYKLLMH